MRYISRYRSYAILDENNNVARQSGQELRFIRGVLVVGSLTSNSGAGNAIDPTDLLVLDGLEGGSGLAKNGLNTVFWEAPVRSVANSNATLVAGNWYYVISGTITFAGTTYKVGERFKAGSSAAFTGSGEVSLDVPEQYYKPEEANFRKEAAAINNYERATDTTYDPATWKVEDTKWGDAGLR